MSNREEILTKIINGETVTDTPTSRSEQYLTAIANGGGAENLPTPISREDQLLMAIAEKGIGGGGGGITPSGSVDITANGTYNVTSYAEANVNVEYKAQDKNVSITENGSQTIQPDEGYDAISSVTVSVNVTSAAADDMLQARVDAARSCMSLFYDYIGSTVDYLKNLDVSGIRRMDSMFFRNTNVTNFDFSSWGWDTSRVQTTAYMFAGCSAATNINLSGWNTANLTDMGSMFQSCNALTSMNIGSWGWDTSSVTNMKSLFYICSGIKSINLSNLDVSNVEDTSSMCGSCKELESFIFGENWKNASKLTKISSMFSGCKKLTSIDTENLNVSKVTNASSMFYECEALMVLDLSTWTLSVNTNFSGMFTSCISLTSLDLNSFDTSKATIMSSMFRNCSALTSILGELDLYSATSNDGMFSSCSALTTVTLKNIRKALTIGSGTTYGHLLSVDSLVNAVKELWDYSSGTTTYKLTMGTANTAKLTDIYVKLITPTAEQIAADPYIESKKPCEVCESTDEGAMLISDYTQLKNWQIQ